MNNEWQQIAAPARQLQDWPGTTAGQGQRALLMSCSQLWMEGHIALLKDFVGSRALPGLLRTMPAWARTCFTGPVAASGAEVAGVPFAVVWAGALGLPSNMAPLHTASKPLTPMLKNGCRKHASLVRFKRMSMSAGQI